MIKNIEEIKDKLLEDIGEKRLLHSIRVAETAIELGEKFPLDREKIFIAGLLHDCGKLKDSDNLLKYADNFGIILDDMFLYNRQLIHADLGAQMAKKIYEVEDEEILNAIKYHTTGKENMTTLEKLIFITDYIEPMRNFKGVEKVRELAQKDLNMAIILSMEQNIKFLIDKGKLIHINTVKGLNYLRLEIMKRGEICID